MKAKDLLKLAEEACETAYAPYSGFQVGAALECGYGTIIRGCNVENASYGLTVCAERIAVFKAVSDGHRKISRIAIAGRDKDQKFRACCPPCGACRQVLAEFAGPDFRIVLGSSGGAYREYTLQELLPLSFELEDRDESI